MERAENLGQILQVGAGLVTLLCNLARIARLLKFSDARRAFLHLCGYCCPRNPIYDHPCLLRTQRH